MSRFTPMAAGPEFDQIRSIIASLGPAADAIGDDAAVIDGGAGKLVISTDVSVDGVHFRQDWLGAEEIGWRSASTALSDLAAMGARAVGLVVAITRPGSLAAAVLNQCMAGVGQAARSAGCRVIGGDLSSGPVLSLAMTVVGRAVRPVFRSGALPGDELWVTGLLGGARAGLLAFESHRVPVPAARLAFARPRARLQAGQWLADQGATAMLDLSDGLAGDAAHLAAASGVRLDIELADLPIHSSVYQAATDVGEAAPIFAAQGGEDYELLVAMPPGWSGGGQAEAWTGIELTRIGAVRSGAGVGLWLEGRERDITGFQHA